MIGNQLGLNGIVTNTLDSYKEENIHGRIEKFFFIFVKNFFSKNIILIFRNYVLTTQIDTLC